MGRRRPLEYKIRWKYLLISYRFLSLPLIDKESDFTLCSSCPLLYNKWTSNLVTENDNSITLLTNLNWVRISRDSSTLPGSSPGRGGEGSLLNITWPAAVAGCRLGIHVDFPCNLFFMAGGWVARVSVPRGPGRSHMVSLWVKQKQRA